MKTKDKIYIIAGGFIVAFLMLQEVQIINQEAIVVDESSINSVDIRDEYDYSFYAKELAKQIEKINLDDDVRRTDIQYFFDTCNYLENQSQDNSYLNEFWKYDSISQNCKTVIEYYSENFI